MSNRGFPTASAFLEMQERRRQYRKHIDALRSCKHMVDDSQPIPPAYLVNRRTRQTRLQMYIMRTGEENIRLISRYNESRNKNKKSTSQLKTKNSRPNWVSEMYNSMAISKNSYSNSGQESQSQKLPPLNSSLENDEIQNDLNQEEIEEQKINNNLIGNEENDNNKAKEDTTIDILNEEEEENQAQNDTQVNIEQTDENINRIEAENENNTESEIKDENDENTEDKINDENENEINNNENDINDEKENESNNENKSNDENENESNNENEINNENGNESNNENKSNDENENTNESENANQDTTQEGMQSVELERNDERKSVDTTLGEAGEKGRLGEMLDVLNGITE